MTKTITKIEDLVPDPENPNRGTKRGLELLETSIEQLGAGRSIVVDKNGVIIAGNKTAEVAAEKGLPVRVVQTDGNELIVHQRVDLDHRTDPRSKQLGVADNQTSHVGLDWDPEVVANLMEDGVDLSSYFFENELADILDDPGGPPPAPPPPAPASGSLVVTVIFESEHDLADFNALVKQRGEQYQTAKVADTILASLRDPNSMQF